MKDALFCTSEELNFGLKHANSKYKYSEYLSVIDAEKVINIVYEKYFL